MQQERPRLLTHFFFKSVGLVNPFEQHTLCMYRCLKLTDLQLSHSVIKTVFYLYLRRVAFTVRPKLKANTLLIELFLLILYFKGYKELVL